MPLTQTYRAAHLLLDEGWVSPGYVTVDAAGTITAAGPEPASGTAELLTGFVVPGLSNVHSHAHQRGLVGWVDQLTPGARETLWSWREHMYDHVLQVTPEDLESQACQAYVEMLKAGFTTVGEFHYLHHDPDGRAYVNPAEMAERIISAARRVGIGLTIIPALYTQAGVGRAPESRQRRFTTSVEGYLQIVEQLRALASGTPLLAVAVAAHSLRAVSAGELSELLAAVPTGPIHIHVSERAEEVKEIQAGLGARPVQWLLSEAGLDERWTLIHATHIDAGERHVVARSGAVAGLCPLTEANLGDGLFPLAEYHRAGGRWAVGTDANHRIDAAGELRMLEYGQRLRRERRDNVTSGRDASVGHVLVKSSLSGGARALTQPTGSIRPGMRADLVELDPNHPALTGQSSATVLDAWIFSAAGPSPVRNVMVGGRWVVRDGQHPAEHDILAAFRTTMHARHAAPM